MKVEGCLGVRLNVICLWPLVYSRVLGGLTALLNQGDTLTFQLTENTLPTSLNSWLFSFVVHFMS